MILTNIPNVTFNYVDIFLAESEKQNQMAQIRNKIFF